MEEKDWARLRSLTADSGFTESGEEKNERVKGLMSRWRSAALRARKLMSDPWMDYNINVLPVIRAKRHRYSAIRKTWTVDIVEVKLLGEPFPRGAMRECFRMKKLSSMSRNQDWTHANNYVAKRYIQEVDREVLFSDVRLQMDAKPQRETTIFPIDTMTARDLDDALSIDPCDDIDGKGTPGWEMGVHIADVAHFVMEGNKLDKWASHRVTSVYLVHKVIPMLPRILCEELCSLNPGVDRLAFSVI